MYSKILNSFGSFGVNGVILAGNCVVIALHKQLALAEDAAAAATAAAAESAAAESAAAEKEGRVRVGDMKADQADGDESIDRGAGVKRPLGRTIEVVEGARESQKDEGAGGRKQNDGGLGTKAAGKMGVDDGGSGRSRRKKTPPMRTRRHHHRSNHRGGGWFKNGPPNSTFCDPRFRNTSRRRRSKRSRKRTDA